MNSFPDCKLQAHAKPFVKWAGGKGQLLDKFDAFYPQGLKNGHVKTYIEPFLGGGAVLFDVMRKFEVKRAFVFDINRELINTYQVIKSSIEPLIKILGELESEYIGSSEKKRKEMYYTVRERFNGGCSKLEEMAVEMAGWFIFLNRTCFNGLYRVNKAGGFNVPSGDYKNPTICDRDNLLAVHALLQKVEIFNGYYEQSFQYCDENTFIYFDPPYRPLNNTSSFTSYSKDSFNDDEQRKLGLFFAKCAQKGAFCMLSNSDPRNENKEDDFFDTLYQDYSINRVMAKRSINSNAGKRGLITEIVVTNYGVSS